MLDKQHLLKIARTPMPFGKYQGRMLVDLPESTCCGSTRKASRLVNSGG